MKVWSASNGQEILTLREPMIAVSSVTFSPDGRQLAVGATDGGTRVWDASLWKTEPIKAQKPILTLHSSSAVLSLAFSPDSRQLAAGYEDHDVRIWETATGREVLPLRGHFGAVRALAFSPDGWQLASASADRTVKIWDATADRRTIPFYDRQIGAAGVSSIAFSPTDVGWPPPVLTWQSGSGTRPLPRSPKPCAATPTTSPASRSAPTANGWLPAARTEPSRSGMSPPGSGCAIFKDSTPRSRGSHLLPTAAGSHAAAIAAPRPARCRSGTSPRPTS